MESISVQLPAALYTSIYGRYGEETSASIAACLSQLVNLELPESTSVEVQHFRYPRPRPGTITGRVWEVADRILKETKSVSREAVIRECMQQGININTASTQFSYWRKANP